MDQATWDQEEIDRAKEYVWRSEELTEAALEDGHATRDFRGQDDG
jgi:hypothetical protein